MSDFWFAAAKSADFAAVRSLGIKYVKSHNHNDNEQTALLYAVDSNNMQVISYLAAHETRETNAFGWTALMLAAYNGNIDAMQLLLEEEKNMRTREECKGIPAGATALLIAATNGHADCVAALYPVERNSSGWNDLFFAAFAHNAALVAKHLSHLSTRDTLGRTAMMYLVMFPRHTTIALLEETISQLAPTQQGAIDACSKTALMYAAEGNNVDAVQLLLRLTTLEKRKQMEAKDEYTALMIAASRGYNEIVSYLLPIEAGIKTSNGVTALMLAVRYNQIDAVRLLSEKEAHIQTSGPFDVFSPAATAISIAQYYQRKELLSILGASTLSAIASANYNDKHIASSTPKTPTGMTASSALSSQHKTNLAAMVNNEHPELAPLSPITGVPANTLPITPAKRSSTNPLTEDQLVLTDTQTVAVLSNAEALERLKETNQDLATRVFSMQRSMQLESMEQQNIINKLEIELDLLHQRKNELEGKLKLAEEKIIMYKDYSQQAYKHNESLNKKLSEMKEQFEATMKQNVQFSAELTSLRVEKAALEETQQDITVKFEKLQKTAVEEKDSYTVQLHAAAEEVKVLRNELDTVRKTVSETKSRAENAEQSSTSAAKDLAHYKAQTQTLTDELLDLGAKYKENLSQNDTLKKTTAEMSEALQKALASITTLTEENSFLKDRLTEFEASNTMLRSTITEVNKEKIAQELEYDKLNNQAVNMEEQVQSLKQELQKTVDEADSTFKRLADQTLVVQSARATIDRLEKSLADLTNERDVLVAQSQADQERLALIKSELQTARQEMVTVKDAYANLSSRHDKLSATMRDAEQQLAEKTSFIEKVTAAKATLEEKLAALDEQFRELNKEVTTRQQELSLVRTELQILEKKNKCLEDHIKHIEVSSEGLNKEKVSLALRMQDIVAEKESLSSQLNSLTLQAEQLKDEKVALELQVSNMMATITQSQEERTAHMKQIADQTRHSSELDEEIGQLRDKLKKANEEVHDLTAKLAISDGESAKTEGKLVKLSKERNTLFKDLSAANKELSDMKLANDTLTKDYQSAQQKLKEMAAARKFLEQSSTSSTKKIASLTEAKTSLEKQLTIANTHISELEQRILELERKNSEAQQAIAAREQDVDNTKRSLSIVSRQLQDTKVDNESVQKSVVSLTKELTSIQVLKEQAESVATALNKKVIELKEEGNTVKEQLKEAKDQIVELRNAYDNVEIAHFATTNKVSELTLENKGLNELIAELKAKTMSTENALHDMTAERDLALRTLRDTETQLATSDSHLQSNQEMIARLQLDLSAATSEHRSLQEDFSTQVKRYDDLQAANKQLNQQYIELTNEKTNLEKQLQIEVSSLEQERNRVDELQHELDAYKKKHDELYQEYTQLEQTLMAKKIDIEHMEESKLSADEALQRATERCTALRAEINLGQRSLESMSHHIKKLQAEVEVHQQRNADLQNKISNMNLAKDSVDRELKATVKKIADAEQRVVDVMKEKDNIFKGLQSVMSEKDSVERKLKVALQSTEEQRAEIETLKKALAASSELTTDLTSTSESNIKNIQQLTRQLTEAQGEIAGLRRGAELSTARITELEALCDSQSKRISENNNLCTEAQMEKDLLAKKLTACTLSLKEVEESMAALEKDYSEQSKKLMEIEATNVSLQRTVETLQKVKEELETTVSTLNQAMTDNTQRIVELEGKKDILERTIAHINKKNTSLEAEREQLAKTLIDINKAAADAEAERASFSKANVTLQGTVTELDSKVARLTATLSEKAAEVFDLESQLETIKAANVELTAMKAKLETKYNMLEAQLKQESTTLKDLERGKTDVESLLLTANKKISEQELAFHTAERTLKSTKSKLKQAEKEKENALTTQEELRTKIDVLSKAVEEHEGTIDSLSKQLAERDRDNESLRIIANGHRDNEEKAQQEIERQMKALLDCQQQISQANLERISLTKQIDQEKKKLTELTALKSDIEEDLNGYKKKYADLGSEYDELKRTLANNSAVSEKLMLQCSGLTAELSALKLQHNAVRVDLEAAQLAAETNKRNASALQAEVERVSHELQQANASNMQLRVEQEVLQQKLDHATTNMAALVSQGESLSKTTLDNNKKLHSYIDEINVKANEIDSLKRTLLQREADLEEIQARLIGKSTEIATLYADKEHADTQIQTLITEAAELQLSLDSLTSTLESQKQINKDLDSEIVAVRGNLKNAHMERDRLEEELRVYQNSRGEANVQIETLNQKIATYDKQISMIVEEKEGLSKLVSQLKLTINELTLAKQETSASLAAEKIAKMKLVSDNEDLMTRIETGKAAYDELSSEYKTLLENYHALNSMKELATIELDALRGTVNLTKTDMERLSSNYEEYTRMSQDRAVITELRAEIEKLENKNKFLLDEKVQCTKIIKSLNKDIVSLKLQLNSFEQSKDNADRQLATLGVDKEHLMHELEILRQKTSDQDSTIQELEKQAKEAERLKEDLAHMNATMSEFADMYAVTINKYADAMRHHNDMDKFMPKYNTYMSDAGLMTDARLRQFLENNRTLLDEKNLLERKFARLNEYINYIKMELINTDMKYLAWIQHKTAMFNRSLTTVEPRRKSTSITTVISKDARRLSTNLEPTDFSASDEVNIERASLDQALLAKQIQKPPTYDATRIAQYDRYPSRPSSQNN